VYRTLTRSSYYYDKDLEDSYRFQSVAKKDGGLPDNSLLYFHFVPAERHTREKCHSNSLLYEELGPSKPDDVHL